MTEKLKTTNVPAPASRKDYVEGHRERLRNKVLGAGADALADYELLEFLLTLAIPRKDVKPIAKDLLYRFGSFAAVISAPALELMEVSGIKETSAATLKSVQMGAARLVKEQMDSGQFISSWDKLVAYCRATIAYNKEETIKILYLDAKNKLIADKELKTGTVSEVVFYPREITRQAITYRAVSVIIAHNHPSGSCNPSKNDVELTKELRKSLAASGISLLDHVIVSPSGYFSFQMQGLFL